MHTRDYWRPGAAQVRLAARVADAWIAIADERVRQISSEGWTPAHDDRHVGGELMEAARIYLWHGTSKQTAFEGGLLPVGWPWEAERWKPKDRRANLIRAGALCLAEHDRCVRAHLPTIFADSRLEICLRELTALEVAE